MIVNAKGLRVDTDTAEWFTSSFTGHEPSCVEVAWVDGGAAVRDSKDPNGPALLFNDAEWDAFRNGVANGEFVRP